MSDKSKLLYYPYINVPKNGWTSNAALYYDEVAIIAPDDFITNPISFNKLTRSYFDSGLLKAVRPDDFNINKHRVTSEIINEIKKSSFNLKKRQRRYLFYRRGRIYKHKFNDELFYILKELKLCSKKPTKDGVFFVEKHTSNLLMLYLSTAFAKSGGYLPSTDQKYSVRNFTTSDYRITKDNITNIIIPKVLPYPKNASPYQIRDFKEKYFEELKEFRIYVDEVSRQLSLYENPQTRKEELEKRTKDINERKEFLIGIFNKENHKDVNQSDFEKAIITGMIATLFHTWLPWLGYGAGKLREKIKKVATEKVVVEPLSYLCLAESRFG